MPFDYDVLIIGSGFGGSVSALRLTEKGYRVGVLEAGRRFARTDFPSSNWDAKRFLWAPHVGCHGIQRITLLNDVLVLSGAGVGGGSLVYANTLYEPHDPYFRDPQWAHITDWKAELAPNYALAKAMLGVTRTPFITPADEVLREVARELGVEETFVPTPVGVFFGKPGVSVPDPYFGGEGPDRVGCTHCGGCMVGCRHGAKNTLDQNYLYLAEKRGAKIHPGREVTDVIPLEGGGFEVVTQRPGALFRKDRQRFRAEQVIFSAGSLGTQRLLHTLKATRRLPNLSPRLGELTRTNSEAIVGARSNRLTRDYSHGVAITSSIHPNEHTHIEPCRYPPGSNLMGLLSTVMVDGGGRVPRWLKFLGAIVSHPLTFLKMLSVRRWSERSVILLVMQSFDNSLTTRLKRGLFGRTLTTRQGHGQPNPPWIPVAHQAARIAAKTMDGVALGSWFEATLNVPTTAHILGGCPIGATAKEGVIDPYHRLYGYPGLHVVDGSAITANLGVNPSLSITALAERAMSFWPNRGDADPRPAVGAAYEPLLPVLAQDPVLRISLSVQ